MRAGVAAVAVAALLASTLAGSSPSNANTCSSACGSASSAAAEVDTGSTLTTTSSVKLLGAISLNTLTTNVVTPLLNALTALPQSLINTLTTALVTGTGLQATNPSTTQNRPAAGTFPVCGQQGWVASTASATNDCYTLTSPTTATSSLVNLSLNAAQGYATGDTQGYIGAAHVAAPSLTLLGIALGNLGVVESTASCSSASPSVCAATQAITQNASLLGGAVTLSLANGTSVVTVNGTPLLSGHTVTVAGLTTATLNGNLLSLKIGLNLTQLLGILGLPNLLTVLGALGVITDNGTQATLTVTLGPGNTIAAGTSAESWGLQVGVDLTTDIKLAVALLLPLATIEVTAGGTGADPVNKPDLVNLKLAHSAAQAGATAPTWVPPGLI